MSKSAEPALGSVTATSHLWPLTPSDVAGVTEGLFHFIPLELIQFTLHMCLVTTLLDSMVIKLLK